MTSVKENIKACCQIQRYSSVCITRLSPVLLIKSQWLKTKVNFSFATPVGYGSAASWFHVSFTERAMLKKEPSSEICCFLEGKSKYGITELLLSLGMHWPECHMHKAHLKGWEVYASNRKGHQRGGHAGIGPSTEGSKNYNKVRKSRIL